MTSWSVAMLSQTCRVALQSNLATLKYPSVSGLTTAPYRATSTDAQPLARLKLVRQPGPNFDEFVQIAEARERRRNAERLHQLEDASKEVRPFQSVMRSHQIWPLLRDSPSVVQINIGKFCNLVCRHCHVESGPTKTRENMDLKTIRRCLDLLKSSPSITTVDITGGAPELNPHFRTLVEEARAMGKTVIDRCNLVVLFEQGQEDLATFLANQGVNIVASLPCYTPENTDKQRGRRVFNDSILALKMLNQLGFGRHVHSNTSTANSLRLDLVYNPNGPSLPPSQPELEEQYRTSLQEEYGITFNSLFTITNMPIKRFADSLLQTGRYAAYMDLLAQSFNVNTVNGLMCRHTVNVAWDGNIYDCDFNNALDMRSKGSVGGKRANLDIWVIRSFQELQGGQIQTAKHCFGCTAGSGSSCGGALT